MLLLAAEKLNLPAHIPRSITGAFSTRSAALFAAACLNPATSMEHHNVNALASALPNCVHTYTPALTLVYTAHAQNTQMRMLVCCAAG